MTQIGLPSNETIAEHSLSLSLSMYMCLKNAAMNYVKEKFLLFISIVFMFLFHLSRFISTEPKRNHNTGSQNISHETVVL